MERQAEDVRYKNFPFDCMTNHDRIRFYIATGQRVGPWWVAIQSNPRYPRKSCQEFYQLRNRNGSWLRDVVIFPQSRVDHNCRGRIVADVTNEKMLVIDVVWRLGESFSMARMPNHLLPFLPNSKVSRPPPPPNPTSCSLNHRSLTLNKVTVSSNGKAERDKLLHFEFDFICQIVQFSF